jgi:hypothetical protein
MKELKDGVKLQQLKDVVPNQLADKVIPVMEVNPKLLRRCNLVRSIDATNATSGTIYTVPTDRDFYLVAASISTIKDVTATSVESAITVFIDGVARKLLSIAGITLTTQTLALANSFPDPIKIDRGTNISVTNTTNVGNIKSIGGIAGYTVENINA